MSEPDFAVDNDGYALPGEICRVVRRPAPVVMVLLRHGAERGRFETRPHPTRVDRWGHPLVEYKAITENDRVAPKVKTGPSELCEGNEHSNSR